MDDVIIIGGGPSGSTLGSYLSMAGIKNSIYEASTHPRPHVGESLVPITNLVLKEIGLIDSMENEGFVHKHGAAWHPTRRAAAVTVDFRDFPLPGLDQDHTYHVDRSRFDNLLLRHAESLGTEVHENAPVRKVLFNNGRAVGVHVRLGDRDVDRPANIVVDASGRSTLLGRQMKWKENDPLFDQFCVHSWFTGVDRGDKELENEIHIFFIPVHRGWAWQIPIDDQITSVGIVAERAVFKKSRRDFSGWFHSLSQSTPNFANAMRCASRVREFTVEADYSYAMSKFASDGCLLVGDAARFVDPIFSSGVSVALHSARFASKTIRRALSKGDVSASELSDYETRLRKGTQIWYEFITLYYKLIPLFTRFSTSSKTNRHQLLELLQGDVFDREDVPVLDAMRCFIRDVEKTEAHVLEPYLDSELPPEIDLPSLTLRGK